MVDRVNYTRFFELDVGDQFDEIQTSGLLIYIINLQGPYGNLTITPIVVLTYFRCLFFDI